MEFIGDIHIHSCYSRATSKNLSLESLYYWSKIKGIALCGTGDCTHPQWLRHAQQHLELDPERGLYRLTKEREDALDAQLPLHSDIPVRFMLSGEISTIYKYGGKTRKVHHVVCMPDFSAAQRLQTALRRVGNIASDGRPILGLDSRDLLEIVLECSSDAFFIPAHIWTPWFSSLGSKSGFDSIEECYRDLSSHIYAVETGLSSDPPMNWRVSSLDKYTLVSNSDAHSASKLGREANCFDCPLEYESVIEAMKHGWSKGFRGTIEFYPQEGKYHLDGHRKCDIRFEPKESKAHQGKCPVCGRTLTLGVMYRVHELADRPEGATHKNALPYHSLLSLDSILSQLTGRGPATKTVQKLYTDLIARCGPELTILMQLPCETITQAHSSLLAEAIRRVRTAQVHTSPGYDGTYGIIEAISEKERLNKGAQASLFEGWTRSSDTIRHSAGKKKTNNNDTTAVNETTQDERSGGPESRGTNSTLNTQQQQVVMHPQGSQIVRAGPGTGKTRTLLERILYLISHRQIEPSRILAITFSNRAAAEIDERITSRSDRINDNNAVCVTTFHKLGFMMLREHFDILGFDALPSVISDTDNKQRFQLLCTLNAPTNTSCDFSDIEKEAIARISAESVIPHPADFLASIDPRFGEYAQRRYHEGMIDYLDLLLFPLYLLSGFEKIRERWSRKWSCIFVDEYQDINTLQYRLLSLLQNETTHMCAIGDPWQAIYAFRGSSPEFFQRFRQDYPHALYTTLRVNYRCTEEICGAAQDVIAPLLTDDISLKSAAGKGPKVRIVSTATEASEAEYVVCRIEELIGGSSHFAHDSGRASVDENEQLGFEDIAILMRTHASGDFMQQALERSSIPTQRVRRGAILSHKDIQKALSMLRFSASAQNRMHAAHLFSHTLPGISRKARSHILQGIHTRDDIPAGLFTELANHPRISPSTAQALHNLEEARTHLEYAFSSGNLRSSLETAALATGTAEEDLHHFPWDILLPYAEGFGEIEDFLTTLSMGRDSDFYHPRAQGITLTTLHASKGLEWPVVFIIGCDEGRIPLTEHTRDCDLAEERRLLYVGMTRARHTLFCTYPRDRRREKQSSSRSLSPFLTNCSLKNAIFEEVESIAKKNDCTEKQLDLFS